MTAEFVIPAVLRADPVRFVPRQSPGRREPARVTAGAFSAAGLPVPERPAQRNAYQLTQRQGLPWSAAVDAWIGRRGGELLGHGSVIQVDADVPAAVDGTPMLDPLRWLADQATEAGEILDLSATVAVRTPGHRDSGHLPGWHLWYAADREHPVRMGLLARCRHVELRSRGTCPGSPGYVVRSVPEVLPVLPPWLADLAGPPPATVAGTVTSAARPWNRLHGIVEHLLAAEQGERNRLLFWASARTGELVREGALDLAAAEKVLRDAAAAIGLVAEDGDGAVSATIASGLRQGAIR